MNDQFVRAVELLGQEDVAGKLGGLYALEGIAKVNPDYYERVFDILTMYLRTKCAIADFEESDPHGHQPLVSRNAVEEAQPIMEVIARRFQGLDPMDAARKRDYVVDLSWCRLPRLRLNGGDLSGVNFSRSYLRNSSFEGADLSGANLILTNLINGQLRGANLSNSRTTGLKLVNALLEGADLRGDDLHWRNLTGVKSDSETQWPDGFDTNTIRGYEPPAAR